jgi:transposase InsO family protein
MNLATLNLRTEGTKDEIIEYLVDTGSEVSVIKKGKLRGDKMCRVSHIPLSGIGAGVVTTRGSTGLRISVRDEIFEHEFLVVPDDFPIPVDAILGLDFLTRQKITLDFDTGTVITQKHKLKLENRNFSSTGPRGFKIARDRIKVPARTHKLINVGINSVNPCIIANKKIANGVFLAACLVQPSGGNAKVSVANTTEEDIELEKLEFDYEEFSEVLEGSTQSKDLEVSRERYEKLLKEISLVHLNKEEKKELLEVIKNNSSVFYLEGDKLGKVPGFEQDIETKSGLKPVYVRPYRTPHALRGELRSQVKKLLENDVIEEAPFSKWNAPVLLVPKKQDKEGNHSWRMVVDFRKLNEVTEGDEYPLPLIDSIFSQLGRAKYFTVLDLASGFYQMELRKEAREKTAFTVPGGKFKFKRCPMGLKGSPAAFQRMMDCVLTGLNHETCFIYMDDVIVFAENVKEHNKRLDKVLKRLKDNNLKVQVQKCAFLRKEIRYLGHIIDQEGIRPDPRTVEKVRNFIKPRDKKGVQRFLGLAGYYRQFVKEFAKVAQPLSKLTRKNEKFNWEEAQQLAFEELKLRVTKAPILRFPDFTKQFIVTTDASDFALGGVISQYDEKEKLDLPVAFCSRILNKAEKNYSTTEKELLAIVFTLKHFREYLYGRKFQVMTDHKALEYISNLKEPSSRLMRWRLALEEYNFEIKYIPGKTNSVADALSRMYITRKQARNNANDDSDLDAGAGPSGVNRNIAYDTESDSETETEDEKEIDENISKEKKLEILKECHNSVVGGHKGFKSTLQKVKKIVSWRGMGKEIKEYVRKCEKCQMNKITQKSAKNPMIITDTPERPWEKICLDVVGPLPEIAGKKYLLTFQDSFSKFVGAIPMKNQESETIARKMVKHIICAYGLPEVILTDQGANFTGSLFKNLCKMLGIKKIQTSAYRPQSNGALERFHRTLKEFIRNFAEKGNWDELAPLGCFSYNITENDSTGFTPIEILLGREVELPSSFKEKSKPFYAYGDYVAELRESMIRINKEVRDNIIKAKETSQKFYNKKAVQRKFKIGDKIKIKVENVRRGRSKKLEPQWEGPYVITDIISASNVKVKKGRKEEVIHVDRINSYY